MKAEYKTIDEYIKTFPPEVQDALEKVRITIHETAPEATETISYAMAAFDLNRRHLVFFAGFKNHVGFYPGGVTVNEAFKDELTGYKTGKGSIQFPLGQPLPVGLIRRMVRFRIDEEARRRGA